MTPTIVKQAMQWLKKMGIAIECNAALEQFRKNGGIMYIFFLHPKFEVRIVNIIAGCAPNNSIN